MHSSFLPSFLGLFFCRSRTSWLGKARLRHPCPTAALSPPPVSARAHARGRTNTPSPALPPSLSSLRGKVLASFLKSIGHIIPLMDGEHAFYYTREVMVVLRREFATPDEEMKKIVLKVRLAMVFMAITITMGLQAGQGMCPCPCGQRHST